MNILLKHAYEQFKNYKDHKIRVVSWRRGWSFSKNILGCYNILKGNLRNKSDVHILRTTKGWNQQVRWAEIFVLFNTSGSLTDYERTYITKDIHRKNLIAGKKVITLIEVGPNS